MRRVVCFRSLFLLFLVSLFLSGFGKLAQSKEQSARLKASVEAGSTHATRLGNLPKEAALAVRLESDGNVRVWLLDEGGFAGFPHSEDPLFEGQTSDRLRFSVRIPESGDYYLVLDNRENDAARSFTLAVKASADASATSSKANEIIAKLARARAELEEFEENLRKVFVFDELEFKLGRCGTGNAFSDDDTVYICAEMGPRLMEGIGDEAKARDALLFTMLHEVGHVLLRQWDYPFYDNEEVADEFATVLMVLFAQGERARTQAEYFATLSPDEELARKRGRDDRHPLSVQRARNIIGWLEDEDLVRRWQSVLIPHMQTSVLQGLQLQPKEWTDIALVKQELTQRRRQ